MPNGKVIITHLTAGLITMSYVSEPYTCSKNKIKAELYLSNYATNSDLKNATVVNTSKFAKEADFARLKTLVPFLAI